MADEAEVADKPAEADEAEAYEPTMPRSMKLTLRPMKLTRPKPMRLTPRPMTPLRPL